VPATARVAVKPASRSDLAPSVAACSGSQPAAARLRTLEQRLRAPGRRCVSGRGRKDGWPRLGAGRAPIGPTRPAPQPARSGAHATSARAVGSARAGRQLFPRRRAWRRHSGRPREGRVIDVWWDTREECRHFSAHPGHWVGVGCVWARLPQRRYRLKPTGERVKAEIELMRPTADDRDLGNECS
jgi:hypothetical protein